MKEHQNDCGCYDCTVRREPDRYRQPRTWRGLLRRISKQFLLLSFSR